jgi:hypothetical protein
MSTSTIADHAERIARALLGTPNEKLSTKNQLRYGTNGSLAIEIAGDKTGTWFDHENQVGGGMLALVQRERNCDKAAAVEWLKTELGIELKPGNGAGERQRRVAAYIYHDQHWEPVYCVSRWGPFKTFTQERHDPASGKFISGLDGVELVPYRLPELLADTTARVWITEGEKDADRLVELGLVATTNPGGAGKWPAGFAQYFTGRECVVLPDSDRAGHDHAHDVAAKLKPVAAAVRTLVLPGLLPKQDVSDWLDHGHTVEQLVALLEEPAKATQDAAAGARAAKAAVAGTGLLDDVRAFLLRFVSYPSSEAAVAHVLWIAHAHLMDAWESTPRIAFLSPEPASGKTRALELTELLVPRPVEAINVSPPY